MIKKVLFFIVAILMVNITAVMAKINYVPLYTVNLETGANVDSLQLFITQDGHKLTLPSNGEFLEYQVFNREVFKGLIRRDFEPVVILPAEFVGDYEIRLYANNYYCHGFFTLEGESDSGTTGDSGLWENITLLGSNTSQQAILDDMMMLHVVEYNMKPQGGQSEEMLSYLSEEEREAYYQYWEERKDELRGQRRIGLLADELIEVLPQVVVKLQDGTYGINYMDIVPVLISCIQELKIQLDGRTEKIVNAMMSRGSSSSEVSAVRAAIGNTLLSAPPTSVAEPAQVRYLLTDNVTNSYIAVTDMGGRVVAKVPVSPSETSVSIDSGVLGEGIFLCTLFANGEVIGTKRLVKTK